ncbi:MAG: tetratricopeptide repeat protein [Bacteroidales bacterium]|nr:tetratricopeptide repeat protein [Bacteroidales bacterium]
MNKIIRYILLLIIFCILCSCPQEKKKKNSLNSLQTTNYELRLKKAKDDIEKIKILEKIVTKENINDSIKNVYLLQIVDITDRKLKENLKREDVIFLNKLQAWSLYRLGYYYFGIEDYSQALKYFHKAIIILEKLQREKVDIFTNKCKVKIQDTYGSVGQIFLFQGEYDKALKYLNRAREICEMVNDSSGIAANLSFMGILHFYTAEYEKALQYLEKSYEIEKKLGNKENMAYCLGNIANIYLIQGRYQIALNTYFTILKLYDELKNLTAISVTLNNIGNTYKNLGNYDIALQYYIKSLNVKRLIDDKKGIATILSNIANILVIQGKYKEAMEYYNKSLRYHEQLKDKKGTALTLNNIGLIYENQKDYDHALEYYFKSLKIREEIEDKKGIAESFNNIGYIYFKKNKFKEALNYFEKSLMIRNEIGDKKGIAKTLSNMGHTYFVLNNFNKAKEYLYKSIKISEEITDKYIRSKAYSLLSKIYFRENNIIKSKEYGEKAYMFGDETGNIENKKDASEILDSIYWKIGNYKLSRKYYGLYITYRDSIQNEENRKMVLQQYYRILYEKKRATDSITYAKTIEIKNLEIQKQHGEARKNKLIAIITFIGTIVVVTLLLFVYNSLRITKKQKKIIESQKDLITSQKEKIEEIHNELKSSIKYAKKIQEAVLPSGKIINLLRREHFIIFIPKDVVSGDFYWFNIVNNVEIYAVADCTGHGVPGGFMSMLGIAFLNEIVRKKEITQANYVLNELRREIISSLKQQGLQNEQKDGMDISLFVFDRTNNTCQWAGANNSLYIISTCKALNVKKYINANDIQNVVIEYQNFYSVYYFFELKPDKMPIAIHPIMNDFTNYEFQLSSGSLVYLFSDGYADQFGGEKNKKYSYKRFIKTLLQICHLSLSEQKLYLENEILKWKGNNEQTDDITVMGIKI